MTYSLKLFDDLDQSIQLGILASAPKNLGFELAFYHNADFDPATAGLLEGHPLVIHMNHKGVYLGAMDPAMLNHDMSMAQKYGVNRFVLHVSGASRKDFQSPRQAAEDARQLCARFPGMEFCVENVYEPLAWWHAFFQESLPPAIGFTFDLGHSRAFSDSPLDFWLPLLRRLTRENRPLHFHLHSNPGDTDRHEPLFVGDFAGWLGHSDWLALPFEGYLAEFNQMPGLKTLETKLRHSCGDLLWLKDKGLFKPQLA